MEYIRCKNCHVRVAGNYCPNCGQDTKTERLTLRTFLDNMMYGITNVDRGIWYTIAMLFVRPGRMFADYIKGRRVIYFRPFSLLIVLAGVYQLVLMLTEMYFNIGVADAVPPADPTTLPEALQGTILDGSASGSSFIMQIWKTLDQWAGTSIAFRAVITLPLYAIAMKLSFKKINKQGYNYIEYLYITGYMACQRLMISLPLIPYELYNGKDANGSYTKITLFLFFAITLWDVKQLFLLKWGQAVWRTVKMFVRYWLLLIAIFALVIIAAIVIVATSIGVTKFIEVLNDTL